MKIINLDQTEYKKLAPKSFDLEKIEKYRFATDPADVIGFAMRIYEKIIKQLDIT